MMDSPVDTSSTLRKRSRSSLSATTTTSTSTNKSDNNETKRKSATEIAEETAKRVRLAFPQAVPRSLRLAAANTNATMSKKPTSVTTSISGTVSPPTATTSVIPPPTNSATSLSSTSPNGINNNVVKTEATAATIIKDEPVPAVPIDSTQLPPLSSQPPLQSLSSPQSAKPEPRPANSDDDVPPPLEPAPSLSPSSTYASVGERPLLSDDDDDDNDDSDDDGNDKEREQRSARLPNVDHLRGFYCDTCGERITSMSEADHTVTTLHNFNKRMTRPPSVVRREAAAAAEATTRSGSPSSTGATRPRLTKEQRLAARAVRRATKRNIATLATALDNAIRRDLADLRT
jgi:hypothetical protein